MSRPRLLIISFSRIVSDARVLKQVRFFADEYDVTTCGYGPAPEGAARHIEVPEEHQAWAQDRIALMMRRYSAVYDSNPAVRWVRANLDEGFFDAILANDVEAVPLALGLEPRGGVHADLHEYAPGQKTELRRWRWFVAPYLRWLLRTSMPRVGSVTTVGPLLAARYAKELGRDVGVVMNATPYTNLHPTNTAAPIRLVHSGIAQRNRQLEITIDAVEEAAVDVTLDLYLVPNDPTYCGELVERASKSSRVRVLPPVPYEDLVQTLNDYDVGVFVLPPVNPNYAAALPNKLFDFLQARLGLVVGPSPEMAAIVRERNLGEVTEDFTKEGLRSVLEGLVPARVDAWKMASDESSSDLSAEAQSGDWMDAIADLVGRSKT